MNDNKVTILGFFFFLFCASLIGGGLWLTTQVKGLQDRYDELEIERINLEQSTLDLMEQKTVYTSAFNDLKKYRVNTASSDMAFYSMVQEAAQRSGITIQTMRQQGISKEGRGSIILSLKGDYYSLIHVFANWRNLDITARIAGLSLTASQTPETRGEVQADVTVEAMIIAPKNR